MCIVYLVDDSTLSVSDMLTTSEARDIEQVSNILKARSPFECGSNCHVYDVRLPTSCVPVIVMLN